MGRSEDGVIMAEFKWPPGSGGGAGDVVGPASSTDNAVARFNGTGGKLLQNSPVTIDDSGNIATAGTVDGRDVSADGAALDAHIADTSAHGTTGDVVGTSDTQTLTNKTINGASNTLTVRLANDVSGTLPIGNGGTGQTTANDALNALLPAQLGNTAKTLVTDGSNVLWADRLTTSLSSARIFVGNGSGVATAVAVTGDVLLSNTGETSIAAGAIVNADVNASAAISYSKLATMSTGQVLLGNAGTPTATTLSGDVTVGATGVTAIGSGVIVNADISASAAIAGTKVDVVSSTVRGVMPAQTAQLDIGAQITCGQAGFSVDRARAIVYSDSAGVWRMKFNIRVAFTSASVTSLSLTIANLVFVSGNQAVTAFYSGSAVVPRCLTASSGNTIDLANASVTADGAFISGDVELNAKPSWA